MKWQLRLALVFVLVSIAVFLLYPTYSLSPDDSLVNNLCTSAGVTAYQSVDFNPNPSVTCAGDPNKLTSLVGLLGGGYRYIDYTRQHGFPSANTLDQINSGNDPVLFSPLRATIVSALFAILATSITTRFFTPELRRPKSKPQAKTVSS